MKKRKLLTQLLAVVMMMGLLLSLSWFSGIAFANGEAAAEPLGTYECTDILAEASLTQTIDELPVYFVSVEYGYDALLFKQCSKYERVSVRC